jgi:hypothetical protein
MATTWGEARRTMNKHEERHKKPDSDTRDTNAGRQPHPSGNPDLKRQHIDKQRKGDAELAGHEVNRPKAKER